MILGIDYASSDGGSVDPKVTGAAFAYVRASGGLTTDPKWALDRGRWADASIPAGPYHWFNFHGDPIAQAKLFIACADARRPGELPPALDLEADSASALGMAPRGCLAAAEACLEALQEHYGTVVVYTSARVWADVFGNLPSSAMSACPLWLKVPYAWNAHNAPRLDSAPTKYTVPLPWRGARIVQFQGDALGLQGTTSTVDLNRFETATLEMFTVGDKTVNVREFQTANGLTVDGVVGPRTFAAITR